MTTRMSLVFAAAVALSGGAAAAQGMPGMPGMQMPPAQPAPPPRPPHRAHHPAQNATPAEPPAPAPTETPAPLLPAPARAQPDEMQSMSGMMPDQMQGMQRELPTTDMPVERLMSGALGRYPMAREASGTSWQPDAVATMSMDMPMHRAWMLMGHALFNGVYDWQGGRRGDDMAFMSGMVMGMARRDFAGGDTLQLRAMLSPDPLMGVRGYPLLLQTGETANGVTPLIDRQHPHDLFMELSASYAHQLGVRDSVFVYGGLPGEPAFGPPAFMHRLSAMDSPEAPITHHWLDSDHITFGVITAGWVHDNWKIDASRFRGREPDEHRYDFETGALDSTAVRVSWNPTYNLSLQASWADVHSPEELTPTENEKRWSASAIYTDRIGDQGWWSLTGAFGRKRRSDGVTLGGWLAEAALHPNERWTIFARAESVETDELAPGPMHTVARLSLGAVHDWRVNDHATFGVGALVEAHFIPSALDAAYGGDPGGAMGFVRLKLQ